MKWCVFVLGVSRIHVCVCVLQVSICRCKYSPPFEKGGCGVEAFCSASFLPVLHRNLAENATMGPVLLCDGFPRVKLFFFSCCV